MSTAPAPRQALPFLLAAPVLLAWPMLVRSGEAWRAVTGLERTLAEARAEESRSARISVSSRAVPARFTDPVLHAIAGAYRVARISPGRVFYLPKRPF